MTFTSNEVSTHLSRGVLRKFPRFFSSLATDLVLKEKLSGLNIVIAYGLFEGGSYSIKLCLLENYPVLKQIKGFQIEHM